MTHAFNPAQSELGKKTEYDFTYNPNKLFPISRQKNREAIGIYHSPLPFHGYDCWNHYEVSWLNEKGKPIVALAEIIYSCESKNIIESKSMKLYFNSFNNSVFKDASAVAAAVKKDLSACLGHDFLLANIIPLNQVREQKLIPRLNGTSIDDLDITCSIYHVNPQFLEVEEEYVEEILCSDLIKSNCLVTNQPDWCSVQITYKGKKINREGLLRYLVSFRNDNEFHEPCIEKIFVHIKEFCKPEILTVYGRSTRRGGIDINSIRSTQRIDPQEISNIRVCRQ